MEKINILIQIVIYKYQMHNTTIILHKYLSAQKHNTIVINKTIGPTFIFEAINIHHHWCLTSYKLLNDPSNIASLHITIHIKQKKLVELCVRNYATSSDLVNGANGIFKTST
jgi:hypothetical protein